MSDFEDDPYEVHARRFLDRLQRHVRELAEGQLPTEPLIAMFERVWPQVLAAYWWAAGKRDSPLGKELCDAFTACADGDIVQMQNKRPAADIARLAEVVATTARRQNDPNNAALLYRFAGIAKVQAVVLGIAEKTGADIRDILQLASESVSQPFPVDYNVASNSRGTTDGEVQDK